MTWIDWTVIVCSPIYPLWDHIFARWLPWYLRWVITNAIAKKNKRDGNDKQKAEAAEAERLTEVQQSAFHREALEAS